MGLFRRKETLNEQLLREAGLDPSQLLGETASAPAAPEPETAPEPGPPRLSSAGGDVHLGRFGRLGGTGDWDTVATLTAPGLAGDRIEFTTLPNGDLIVGEETGNTDLSRFADALEEHVTAPYRAVGTRQEGDLWGVGAKRIEVAEFPFAAGNALELSENGGVVELRVDGEPSDAIAPVAMQRLGERVGNDFCVEASRIDGDFWEVKASPL